ncbi:MAG TPA: VOC family protein [Lactovum miscens]|uniref:VOC family protein n=1 Tax=Lactovum miscens TaxID=190387 RepID=UPI002ED82677
MTKTVHGKGMPGWVEIVADDTAAAIKFYTELFGWTEQSIGDENFEYHILMNGDKTIGGLSGKMNPGQPSAWLTYLETDNIDATIKDINDNGGTTYMPPTAMPGGRFTIISDPAGSPLGIVESDGVFDSNGEKNGLVWFELDIKDKFLETVEFYKNVFGWDPETGYDTAEMTYLTVAPWIGVYTGPDFPEYFKNHSQWSVTFNVSNIDLFAEKAETLGARIEHVMKDTPYGDFVMLRDLEGAFFVGMTPNQSDKKFN